MELQQTVQSPPISALFFRDFHNSYIPDILEEIYKKQIYAPFLNGKKDLTIADWGGNIGLTSYYFKDYAKRVFCVEPSLQHQEVIQKLIEFNKIKNITLCPYAISNKVGTEKFYHNDNVTMFSLDKTVNKHDDFEEVETIDPETFFKREKIDHLDLLKLDVEGSESLVIASDEFAAVAPRIKVIVGEYHEWTSMSKGLFMNRFRDLGFEFIWNKGTEASVFTAVRI